MIHPLPPIVGAERSHAIACSFSYKIGARANESRMTLAPAPRRLTRRPLHDLGLYRTRLRRRSLNYPRRAWGLGTIRKHPSEKIQPSHFLPNAWLSESRSLWVRLPHPCHL